MASSSSIMSIGSEREDINEDRSIYRIMCNCISSNYISIYVLYSVGCLF